MNEDTYIIKEKERRQALKATEILGKIIDIMLKNRKFGIWMKSPYKVLEEIEEAIFEYSEVMD